MTLRISWVTLSLLAILAAGSTMIRSAVAQNPAFTLGFVDLRRITTEYEGTKQSTVELETYQQTLLKQLQDLEAVRFLDEKDRQEAIDLRKTQSPSAEQRKRLDELGKTNQSRLEQLRALQQNPNRSEAEKTSFDQLTQMSNKTDQDLEALSLKLDEQLQTYGAELSKKLTDKVVVAITEVAKMRGFSAVFDKQAVLYGGTDITDDVMKQLAKG